MFFSMISLVFIYVSIYSHMWEVFSCLWIWFSHMWILLGYDSHICEYCLSCKISLSHNCDHYNIYWIQKNSIEICTSFGFEPLHQKMYYSFILSSEFNKSGKKKWQEVFAATGWLVFQHQYWRRILCPLIIMVIHLLMQNLSVEKLGFQP